MRRVLGMVLALALGISAVAGAQGMGLFRAPTFVLQPGVIGALNGDKLDINARFVTAIPTSIERVTLVGIVQWTPFQDEDDDGNYENTLGFVYGPVVNVVSTREISFDLDALFAYGPTASVPATSFYTHKFLLEGDLFFKFGSMMGMKSQWNSLSLYAMFAYVLTGIDDGAGTGPGGEVQSEDRSVLLLGLSLPLAPWKK